MKYLTLIRAIALLHQYQRPVKTAQHDGQAVALHRGDARRHRASPTAWRTRCSAARSTSCRRRRGGCSVLLDEMVRERVRRSRGSSASDFRFTRRDVREHTGWGNTQLQGPPATASWSSSTCSCTAAAAARASSTSCSTTGEAEGDRPFLAGLIDVETPRSACGTTRTGRGWKADVVGVKSGPSRGRVGGWSGSARSDEQRRARTPACASSTLKSAENARLGSDSATSIVRTCTRPLAAAAETGGPLMPRRGARAKRRAPVGDPTDPHGMAAWRARYLEWLRAHNYSEATVANRDAYLGLFLAWCEERGLTRPSEVTKPILERYQRYLFHYRKPRRPAARPFGASTAGSSPVRGLLQVAHAPERASSPTRPPSSSCRALEHRLPKHVLTASEAEAGARAARPRATPSACATARSSRRSTRPACAAWSWSNLGLYDLDLERGTRDRPPGQGQEGPHGPDRRARRGLDREVPRRGAARARGRARRGRALPHRRRRALLARTA